MAFDSPGSCGSNSAAGMKLQSLAYHTILVHNTCHMMFYHILLQNRPVVLERSIECSQGSSLIVRLHMLMAFRTSRSHSNSYSDFVRIALSDHCIVVRSALDILLC